MVGKISSKTYKAAEKGYQHSRKHKERENGSRKEDKTKLVKKKYRVKRKGLTTVIKKLKQSILAKAPKILQYNQKIQQYRINRLFKVHQKNVHNKFNGQTVSSNRPIRNAEESRTFWSVEN